ncbi:MAG: preprotein translocase subunit SecG [Patescibacteria group bacterium]
MGGLKNILGIVQVILTTLLIGSILLQARGTGLSVTFGGEGSLFRTRRGIERGLFFATIVLAILFFGLALFLVLS